jgi:hypothetical protein
MHALILHHLVDDAGPAVSLSLFGKPIATVFLLGKERQEHLESPVGVGTFVVWEFDPSTRSHRVWMSMIDYVRSRITESGSMSGAAAPQRQSNSGLVAKRAFLEVAENFADLV